MKKFAVFFVWFFYALRIFASDGVVPERFQYFGAREGLPEKFVYSATTDKKGRTWFGTAGGLYFWDGCRFSKQVSTNPESGQNSTALTEHVFYDSINNRIWVAGYYFLYWIDGNSGKAVYTDMKMPEVLKLAKAGIQHISLVNGDVWFATRNAFVARYKSATGKFSFFDQPDFIGTGTVVLKILQTPDAVWLITANGLVKTNKNCNEFKNINPGKENQIINFTDGIYDAVHRIIWLGTAYHGVLQFNPESQIFTHCDLRNADNGKILNISALFIYKDLIGVSEGVLAWFDRGLNAGSREIKAKQPAEKLKLSKVVRLHTDPWGNAWICSYSGLAMIAKEKVDWRNYAIVEKETGFNIELGQIIKWKNEILIASSNSRGLGVLNTQSGAFEVVPNLIAENGKNYYRSIKAVCKNTKGEIFATDGKWIFEYIPESRTLRKLDVKGLGEFIEFGNMITDFQGNMYLENRNQGMVKISGDLKKLEFLNKKEIIGEASDNIMVPLFYSKMAGLVIATLDGVIVQNNRGKFNHFLLPEKARNGNLTVQDACEDLHGNIWITTITNGLFKLTIGKNNRYTYTNYAEAGLKHFPDNYCEEIEIDEQGKLWIGTLHGLVRWDPDSEAVIGSFNRENGMFNDNVDVPIQYFNGGWIGISNFSSLSLGNLRMLENKLRPLQLCVSLCKAGGIDFSLDGELQQKIELPYNRNLLELEFGLAGAAHPERTLYKYKITGSDEYWITLGNNGKLNLTGLAPGAYDLYITAEDYLGIKAEKDIHFKLIITPPFWKTWWFILLIFLLTLGVLIAFNAYRSSQNRRAAAIKEEFNRKLAGMEMKALRAQMNPHFIFNTLNSINKYILKNEQKQASLYLTRFSKLIRLILENSAQNLTSIQNEIELLQLYVDMEKMRFEQGFDFTLEIDSALPVSAEIPSMIIQPFVENAIWHGLLHSESAGKLAIRFKPLDLNSICVEVEDNGIGRAKAAEIKTITRNSKSMGMGITKDRLELLNALGKKKALLEILDLKNENGDAAGTLVKITLPITLHND